MCFARRSRVRRGAIMRWRVGLAGSGRFPWGSASPLGFLRVHEVPTTKPA
ncbi:hypothetical protein HMPREF0578_0038 [Mobiluncus mulieris 28-1]|nr:hypothetical protein HMPREF0578_0038 [Mobiluncus mulieris 28-1]